MNGARGKELRKLNEQVRAAGYTINFRHVKKMYSKYKAGAIDTLHQMIQNPAKNGGK